MNEWIVGGYGETYECGQRALYAVVPLLFGWLLDKWLGDPAWLPHPVVGFGKLISKGEKWLNKGKGRVGKGAVLAVGLVIAVYLLSALLINGLLNLAVKSHSTPLLIVSYLVNALLLFYCLAGTTLVREVRMAFKAVDRSLEEGRKQVSRIVGRDTSYLSTGEVQRAALETLAENLSDGVIAPLFWYLLLGVPGMLAYKMINTLDSMIGYKNERYLLFGSVAARMDDVANYIPARLTACLMVLVSGRLSLFRFVWKHGRKHASPNSGYPEAALAGILNCRFGGPYPYLGVFILKPFIGETERSLTMKDMEQSIRINQWAEAIMVAVVLVILAL